MVSVSISCDYRDGLCRAALWRGRELTDLFVDSLSTPDRTGAILCGKVGRVRAGQKSAWIECGDGERVYVESKMPLQSGAVVLCRIKSDRGQGKAPQGVLIPKTPEADFSFGMIQTPPRPWQRALASLAEGEKARVQFACAEDLALFEASAFAHVTATVQTREPVHPDLDERIAALLEAQVLLSGGASLVIEQTEALVAIGVNAGESDQPSAVNLLAVREVARQIRLRNLGGIILVDCLKMPSRADGSKVVNAFTRAAATDPAAPKVFGLTKLGLLEIARPHTGPSLAQAMRKARP